MFVRSMLTLLSFVAVLSFAPTQSIAGLPAAPKSARSFDHAQHNKIGVLKCEVCHKAKVDGEWEQQGKKEHARCFSCHKYSSVCLELKPKEGRVCATCHTKFKASCMPEGYVPPVLGAHDFSAQYSHKLHISPKTKGRDKCETCHGDVGAATSSFRPREAHAQCSDCHSRHEAPRFSQGCIGCHLSTPRTVSTGAKNSNAYSMRGSFDHKKHAAQKGVGPQGRDCLRCHEQIKNATSKESVTLPAMNDCRTGCHDGEKAFDALGTQCSKCHTPGNTPKAALMPVLAVRDATDTKRRFSHAAHSERFDLKTCETCHRSKGAVVQPVTSGMNHKPCSNGECHASEFMSRKAKICVVCHDTVEPWRQQAPRLRRMQDTEFGANAFSHATHTAGELKLDCQKCHGDVLKGTAAPDAHPVCGECHEKKSEPRMANCSGCHDARVAHKVSPYSVARRFDHASHAVDPRSEDKSVTDCRLCHEGNAASATMGDLTLPTMQSCTACHDGQTAFKTTGFSCKRCHGTKEK